MKREEKIICKAYLDDLDRTHDCNEYKLLMKMLDREPCEDSVSRQQALKELKESAEHHANDSREEALLRRDRNIIRALPSVTPTRKKGKWIKVTETDFGIGYKCSECGRFILTESVDGRKLKDYPYCHCGAEMQEVEE